MWVLEHDILLGEKRTWLRPGSQHLFGRTKGGSGDGGKSVFIDHKAISRQHMMVKVLEVPPGDGTKLHARSQVEITDLSCRQGTIVDGAKTLMSKKEGGTIISYDKTVLSGTEHTIKLSSSYPEFRIKWQPIVFTYSSRESKEAKARNVQLHALDIKTSTDFVYGQTTHVISQKRNLPKVLQGLVTGTYIITSEFLDAVIRVAAPQNTDPENYEASKLEEDFVTWWPKEKEYIPPAGAEPVPQPEHMLLPDPRRSEVFSGLTFVFLNENQYDNLHEAISGGGGKALWFPLQFGKTTVNEYVEFVRNTAGQKRQSLANDDRLPVITIRLSSFPDDMEDWATNFVTGVDQALNQRSIQQNEFLNAIITNDTSSLRKPPAEITIDSSLPTRPNNETSAYEQGPTTRLRGASQVPESTPAQAEEPAKVIPRKRPIRRGITQSRFTGFDDYEPPSKTRKIQEDAVMDDIQESVPTQRSHRDRDTEAPVPTQSQSRRSPPKDTVELMEEEELFPAAAALKKRRAATRGVSASVEPEGPGLSLKPKSKGAQVLEQLQNAKKKVGKEIDVREQTKLRLQEQEEKRRADEERLREALQGVDISEIRGLVQVEEMEIVPRQSRSAQRNDASSDRWNDEWNGRKNFKKFRRRGAERGPQAHKVIVALEEVPQKKGFGLGDGFFLEKPSTAKESANEKPARRKPGLIQDSESEAEAGFTRRKPSKDKEVINVEDSGPDDEEEVPLPSGTLRSRTQRVSETQVRGTQSQTQRKRAPMTVAAGQPPSKRSRITRRDDDSDGEETGFRFKKRG